MDYTCTKNSEKERGNGRNFQPNPEANVGMFSKFFYWYVNPIIKLGYKKKLDFSDLFEPLPENSSSKVTDDLTRIWVDEQSSAQKECRQSSLLRSVFQYNWRRVGLMGMFILLTEIVALLQPLVMGRLIRSFRADSSSSLQADCINAVLIGFADFFLAGVRTQFNEALEKVGHRTRLAASGMIVQKGIRLSSPMINSISVGHIVNLLSSDVDMFRNVPSLNNLWIPPVLFFLYFYALWNEIGVAAFAAYAGMFVLSPIQIYVSKKSGGLRHEVSERADKRISMMNEVINGIRLIKMYAWEEVFTKKVAQLRRSELNKYRRFVTYQSIVSGIFFPFTKVIILPVALCYIYTGNDLTAEAIFVTSALLNSARFPLMLYFPEAISEILELRGAVRRIQKFLSLDEHGTLIINNSCDDGSSTDSPLLLKPVNGKAAVVKLERIKETEFTGKCVDWAVVDNSPQQEAELTLVNYTTCWETEDVKKNEDDENIEKEASSTPTIAIKNVSLSARRGQWIGIVGPVGCGKSSLLASILRETRRISGNLTIRGTIAYCSQEAWIFGGTIRDNILFGRPMDQERYDQALKYSSFLAGLDQIPGGDMAIVGDRGISLSGGQRARVALARAIYSDADIYLLDDPLSAVDAKVGREIFQNCITNFLCDRIVVLVTHQLQFLGHVDQIFLMNEGEIVASGSPKELRESSSDIVAQLFHEAVSTHSTTKTSPPSLDSGESDGSNREKKGLRDRQPSEISSNAEDRAEGAVHWSAYWKYLCAMFTNSVMFSATMFLVFLVQVVFNITDFWLTKWTGASEKAIYLRKNGTITRNDEYRETMNLMIGPTVTMTLSEYQNVFTALTVFLVLISVLRCIWLRSSQTVASEVLHKNMFAAVIATSVKFFDRNSVGRILNRFSKDVYILDDELAFVAFEFSLVLLSLLGSTIVIFYINPYTFLVTAPLLMVILFIRKAYLATSQDVKRLDAVSRSPLYSHISAVMDGLVTVRAFNNGAQAIQTYHRRADLHASSFFLDVTVNHWFSVNVDWCVSTFVTLVALGAVWAPAVFTSGEVALMLMYAIEISGSFSWFLQISADLQNHMVSLERILDYSSLPAESYDEGIKEQTIKDWPTKGSVEFDSLCLKYNAKGDFALRDLSFSIAGNEKIGIVGRTGAGKSSLLRALFRLTPAFKGHIFIDGIDIATIPLKTLRRALSIIPQEPVLFIGTVRYNLDPFEEHTDEQLWEALSEVQLKDAISQLPGGLDASMQEGGANFSVGQRQLVCLARAILRKAKILVIDEATANVDQHTDKLIQATIRDRFRNSTVLTIAHRLNTVMDSDRIFVMGDGHLKEFDSPHTLLMEPESDLTSLIEETGRESAAHLRSIAYEAFCKQSSSELRSIFTFDATLGDIQ